MRQVRGGSAPTKTEMQKRTPRTRRERVVKACGHVGIATLFADQQPDPDAPCLECIWAKKAKRFREENES